MVKRVPVTVLTGYLGSGKTTLLNRILTENHGKRIAVIENEFGEAGIDNELVINADEEIFEMNNGCICCTVRGDLIRILSSLMRRKERFDYVVIETTGLADPAPVAQTFFVDEEMRAQLRLDAIVTVVDARHVHLHLEDSSECQEQIAFADVILLNKCDLVAEDELKRLEQRIRTMNTMAKIHRTVDAVVQMDHILDVGGFDLDRALSVKPTFLEPEYRFEWAGIYRLEPGEYRLCLQDGPDPEVLMVMLPAPEPDAAAIEALQEQVALTYSATARPVSPGSRIAPGPDLLELLLVEEGEKPFPISITEGGNYAIFTQHHPDEFQLRLEGPAGPVTPTATREYNPGHEHDDQVGSVAITLPGELDDRRLNKWLSQLLMEKGPDIFRMKGILAIKGAAERFVFQGVHMLFDGRPDRPWGEDARSNQLVFIGRNLDRELLTEGFRKCLA